MLISILTIWVVVLMAPARSVADTAAAAIPDETEINQRFELVRTPSVGTVRTYRRTNPKRTYEIWWEFLGTTEEADGSFRHRYANEQAVVEYESRNGNIVRYRFVNDTANHRYFYDPDYGKYRFPLWIGKEWKTGHVEYYAKSGTREPERMPGSRRRFVYQHGRVVAAELIETVTGRQAALRVEWIIERLNTEFSRIEKRTSWLSIKHGHLLRQVTWEVGNREKTLKVLELVDIREPEGADE